MYLDHINISAPCDVINREKAFLMDILDLVDGKKAVLPKLGIGCILGSVL